MKRRSLLALGAAMIVTAATFGTAHAEDAELVVGLNISGAPFAFPQGDHYTGFEVEFWDAVAKGIGRKYRLQPMEFASLIPALQTKNIDVVMSQLFIKPEREQVIDFSIPYARTGLTAVMNINNTTIKTAADLAGKVIGTEIGTGAVDFVKKQIPNAQLELLPSIHNALLALEAGRTDAVIYDAPQMAHYADDAGKGKVRLLGELLTTFKCGIGLQKGSKLRDPINRQIRAMLADGSLDALRKKWGLEIEALN